jgi:hypothetical protein
MDATGSIRKVRTLWTLWTFWTLWTHGTASGQETERQASESVERQPDVGLTDPIGPWQRRHTSHCGHGQGAAEDPRHPGGEESISPPRSTSPLNQQKESGQGHRFESQLPQAITTGDRTGS